MAQLDWNDIKVFLALYRCRSIRAAAEELGMSHSTVSRHLTDLETSLGAVLFTRSRDGMLATSMSEQIFARAERVEGEVFDLQREANSLDTALVGQVRVTAPPLLSQYMLMPHLAAFAEQYPGIEISLNSSFSIEDLMKGAADVAFRSQFDPNENLVGRRLPDFVDMAYASPDYIARHAFENGKTDAVWIGRGLIDPSHGWVKEGPFPDAPVKHQIPDMLDQAEAAKEGLGMVVLPCFFADALEGLQRIPGVGAVSSRPGWVLTHPDLRSSVRVMTFVRFLVAEMTKQKAQIQGDIR
ncbi:Transcriptional regulator, LysR family [Candidatus Rhodobacter oscarellae]|uniref:Transcriptional regulator, LysR family n=1 Tax=Candidatus Rhodobacter oscarellae TaxID=1675527 RepID=A0A0J9GXD2_9RHOB|nr:LysR family transcriptional regulator [Candidatus Rhodobacter lobularis]KMW58148.1 Transcriptional regulator, LysR family [Candidatus Rhodobacter lobularis]